MTGMIAQDLRFGLRMLLRQPGFTAVAVITLALGIGANTAIFSVVNAVLLRPLPYDEPEQLVWLWESNQASDIAEEPASLPNFLDWKEQNRSFEEMAAFTLWLPTLTDAGEPERIPGSIVTAGFFSILRARPLLGRTFTADDDQPGKNRVVVLSYGLWQRRFAGDETVVGKTITLNGNSYTVIGVMPASFGHPAPDERAPQIWAPLGMTGSQVQRRQDFLYVIGRRNSDISLEQTKVEFESIASRLAQQYPESNAGWGVTLMPLHERFVGNVRKVMLVLMFAVGLLVLIACANVANLLLVRSTVRQKEVAIRTALGASRRRLIRQFLTESLLLASIGGALGTLLAAGGVEAMSAFSPPGIARINAAGIDLYVLGFAFGVSVLAGVLFGVVPAVRAARSDLNESLKEGGRGSTEGPGGFRLRSVLGVIEIAFALMLLIGSMLMIKSLVRLLKVNPGFDSANMLTMELSLSRVKYREGHQAVSFIDGVIEKFGGLPGVSGVAAVTLVPLSGRAPMYNLNIEGRVQPVSGPLTDAELQVVSQSYFEMAGIPLLRGRLFGERDSDTSVPVAVISEEMARRYWPNEDPLERRISVPEIRGGAWLNIVGIVGSVRQVSLDQRPYPQMYIPYKQNPRWATSLLVKTDSDSSQLVGMLRERLKEIDVDQPLYNVRTMAQIRSDSVSRPRFSAQLIVILTAVALVLAAVGIYGVVSYWVSHRTHEMGIRMALGAHRRKILFMVIRQGVGLAVAGIAIGIALAWMLTRWISSLLYEVSATDPATFIAVPAMIGIVVVAACYLPARRATKIDPMVALRYE